MREETSSVLNEAPQGRQGGQWKDGGSDTVKKEQSR